MWISTPALYGSAAMGMLLVLLGGHMFMSTCPVGLEVPSLDGSICHHLPGCPAFKSAVATIDVSPREGGILLLLLLMLPE